MDHQRIKEQKQRTSDFFKTLRDDICHSFENLEREYKGAKGHRDDLKNRKPGVFEYRPWTREDAETESPGGGTMGIMRGRVFEKVGVNISTVEGVFPEAFRKEIPGALENEGRFWASGLSLVAHMHSPHVPAIHMNVRYIVTGKDWFGGGMDLNPMFPKEEETEFFHNSLRDMCHEHDPNYYKRFKEECDRYFYIAHRKMNRGVGGIFYDNLNTGDFEKDFAFCQDVGRVFVDVYPKIVTDSMDLSWTEDERETQLIRRGYYTEFNLVYDRGTRFGLQTGANPEAVLMSLPPEAKWP